MGLKNASILAGAATIAASGGTALVFADDGQTVPNGVHLIVPADADYKTRRQLTAKVRQAILDPKTGLFSKDKKSMVFVKPVVLTDGSTKFSVIRVEREVVVEMSAADALELNVVGAQMLTDADFASFWAYGSLA